MGDADAQHSRAGSDAVAAALERGLGRLAAGADPVERRGLLRYHGLTVLAAALHHASGAEPELARDAAAYTAQFLAWQAEWRRLFDTRPRVGALVMKGAGLAHTLYPEPHWRMMGDLDLLIRPADLDRLDRALVGAGYRATLSAGGDLLVAEQQYERRLSPRLSSLIDVHWALSNRPMLRAWSDWDELWAGSLEIPWLGARALGHRDALLLACVHRTGHHRCDGDRLVWLLDIHLLWTTAGARGQDAAVSAAEAKGLTALLADGLAAAAGWFDTEVEANLRERLLGAARGEPGARLLRRGPTPWQDLRSLPRWPDRRRYLVQLLFPPRAYMRRRYPGGGPLLWLYLRRCLSGLRKALPQRRGRS